MAYFLKENFFVHTKFHPHMDVVILETMVPWVELGVFSKACANVSALTMTFQNLVSSVETFYSCLSAL